jgi:iron complex transport system substrate-binding protein
MLPSFRNGWQGFRAARLALLAALALASGCEPGPPTAQPPRLLVLSVELARLLVQLDAARLIVGADAKSCGLSALASVTSLGELSEGDVAGALALHPTLVLAPAREPERSFADVLLARGVPAEVVDPGSVDEVVAVIRMVGEIVGQPQRARELVDRMRLDISRIAVARDGKRRLSVAWIVDRDPLTVVGTSGLLHEILELAGAENAVHGPGPERLEMGAADLARLRYELIVDSSSGETALPVAAGTTPTLRLLPDAAALPVFDLADRVRLLHQLIYPAGARAERG